MNEDEIIKCLGTGKTKSVCIDRTILSQYPGFVRDITIMDYKMVKVEFSIYGYDVGGFLIKVYYDNFEQLIKSIEEYTGKRIIDWMNVTKTNWYPELKEKPNFEQSGLKFKHNLVEKELEFPNYGIKYVIPEGYWKDLYEGLEKL